MEEDDFWTTSSKMFDLSSWILKSESWHLSITTFWLENFSAMSSILRGVNFKHRLAYLAAFLLALAAVILVLRFNNRHSFDENDSKETVYSRTVAANIPLPMPSFQTCRMHSNDCFNIYRCGYNEDNKISVYVYPFTNYFDEHGIQISPIYSREFYDLLVGLKESGYYTSNMETACIIVPSLDMLNQRRTDVANAGRILSSLARYSITSCSVKFWPCVGLSGLALIHNLLFPVLCPDMPCFMNLIFLTPNSFNSHGKSAVTQYVNQTANASY